MTRNDPNPDNPNFRLRSGSVIRAGWLRNDLPFLNRSLRFLLGAQGDALRSIAALESGDIGVLAVIAGNPGISQNDLAASLVLKKSAVTRVVQRLEKRGLIERRRSETDRRANCLALTHEGSVLAEKLRQATQARHDAWFRDIPDAEREVFFSVLWRLVARLAEDNRQ